MRMKVKEDMNAGGSKGFAQGAANTSGSAGDHNRSFHFSGYGLRLHCSVNSEQQSDRMGSMPGLSAGRAIGPFLFSGPGPHIRISAGKFASGLLFLDFYNCSAFVCTTFGARPVWKLDFSALRAF